MGWRQFLRYPAEVLRVERTGSPEGGTHKTLKTLKNQKAKNRIIPVSPLPKWQYDLCIAHDAFMEVNGNCLHSFDDCLISKLIDCDGNVDKLRGYDIGRGITMDEVLDLWLEMGEPAEGILRPPIWIFCIAEQIHDSSHPGGGADNQNNEQALPDPGHSLLL